MSANNYKTSVFGIVNEGLDETQYAFSDIIYSINRLKGLAKSNGDEGTLIWLKELENHAYGIKEKVSKMNLLFQPYWKPQLEAVSNCLDAELRRLHALKVHLVECHKYEHVAQLRELQNDIFKMQRQIKELTVKN